MYLDFYTKDAIEDIICNAFDESGLNSSIYSTANTAEHMVQQKQHAIKLIVDGIIKRFPQCVCHLEQDHPKPQREGDPWSKEVLVFDGCDYDFDFYDNAKQEWVQGSEDNITPVCWYELPPLYDEENKVIK